MRSFGSHRRRGPSPWWLGLSLLLATVPAGSDRAAAQDLPVLLHLASVQADEETDEPTFDLSGRAIQVYKIPITVPLRSAEEKGWGARLRLPISIGLHEFTAEDILAGDLQLNLETSTFVPRLELDLPLGGPWTLFPFVELGAGTDFSGNQAWIYGVGLTGLAEISKGRWQHTLGTTLEADGSSVSGGGSIGYGTLEVGVDVSYPLSFEIGRPTFFSLYAVQYRYFSLELAGIDDQPFQLENQTELGFTLRTDPAPKWWLITIKRLGFGYRFGDGLSSYRLFFGLPFRAGW